jgi:xylulokinase
MGKSGFVGVDIGTSRCKAVLLTDAGQVVATASRSYAAFHGVDGEVSQDPLDWTRSLAQVLSEIRQQADDLHLTVEALAPTAPAHATVLVDDRGEPLERVIMPYDTRSVEVAEDLDRRLGPAAFERTFARLGPSWTLPQLAWMRSLSPGFWPRIRYALATKDYVGQRLTGAVATDPTDAAGTALYDQRAGKWIGELCLEAGLRVDQLPPILPPDTRLGGVTKEWAAATGLAEGTPVAVGCTDTAAELLSLDATAAGRSLVKIASTGTVVVVIGEPKPDPRVLTYPHCVPGLWYVMTATNSAATAYQWLRGLEFADREDESSIYRGMDEMASSIPPGSDGLLFLPFLTGERSPYWDSRLRAAFLGVSAAHGQSHFARAVLEGVCLSLRDCRDLLSSLAVELQSPFLTGGGATSGLWRSILASVLGVPGIVADPQGPAVGVAILAARAVGVEVRVPRDELEVVPVPDWVAAYDRLYPIYKDAARDVRELSHRLQAQTEAPPPHSRP